MTYIKAKRTIKANHIKRGVHIKLSKRYTERKDDKK